MSLRFATASPELKFESVDLNIKSVTVDNQTAKFTTTSNQLIVSLDHPAPRGERQKIFFQYEGNPLKCLYFILPDKNYPQQPKEVWTQGEAEDTRYYFPLYDYPNDRTTSGNAFDRSRSVDHGIKWQARRRER